MSYVPCDIYASVHYRAIAATAGDDTEIDFTCDTG